MLERHWKSSGKSVYPKENHFLIYTKSISLMKSTVCTAFEGIIFKSCVLKRTFIRIQTIYGHYQKRISKGTERMQREDHEEMFWKWEQHDKNWNKKTIVCHTWGKQEHKVANYQSKNNDCKIYY